MRTIYVLFGNNKTCLYLAKKGQPNISSFCVDSMLLQISSLILSQTSLVKGQTYPTRSKWSPWNPQSETLDLPHIIQERQEFMAVKSPVTD